MAYTLKDIKDANKAAGLHFFDRSTMDFFGSEVYPAVTEGPGGVYFVTTEKPPHGPRRATTRRFRPDTGVCEAVGPFCQQTLAQARARAHGYADGLLDPETE